MKKITVLVWSILLPIILLVILNLIIQPSSAAVDITIAGNVDYETEQVGPGWYDENWDYRLPVVISSSASLTEYQVLVRLDDTHFDFNKADDEGSDVRFTQSDGITEIDYWIESWDKGSQTAYLWVKVPILEIGDTTIYLYYGNPGVGTDSDGVETFLLFDNDWTQFPGGCSIGIPWDCINPGATVSSGNLVLISNTGVSSHDTYTQKAIGYRANYGLGTGLISGGFGNGASGPRTVIRDLSTDIDDLYLQDFASTRIDNNLLKRVEGIDWHNNFHVYEVRWWIDIQNFENNKSIGEIDHGKSIVESMIPLEVPVGELSVTFNNPDNSNATLLVDWVYVREYTYPEPTTIIGEEQGLVDLEVSMVDTPDPLYAGEKITYLMTVSNTRSTDAHGIVLTDTLPAGVILASAIPSQGACDNEIVCDLGTILANSSASITLVVTTTIDGLITNKASVGSLDYDQNIADNTYQEMATVLPSADISVSKVENLEPSRLDKTNAYIETIAYTLTVLNEGPSLAADVILTDTLPTTLTLTSAVTEQGSCKGPNPVKCDLGTIDIDSRVKVMIYVIPTSGGVFTSTVNIRSVAYDPDLANNTTQEVRLVDNTNPVVRWEKPVKDLEYYPTKSGWVTLEASAEDELFPNYPDQINQLVFKWWDHLFDGDGDGKNEGRFVVIGTDTQEPYQVEFDSNVLKQGDIYQIYAYAYDRAGNYGRQRIFFERLPIVFMPIIIR